MEVTIKCIFGVIGAFLGAYLGGFDGFVKALIFFVATDYATGVLSAAKQGKVNSDVGFWGLVKKVMILTMVGVGNLIDAHILGQGAAIRTAVIFFYLSNEGISIIENMAMLGLPVPEKLKRILAQLNDPKRDAIS